MSRREGYNMSTNGRQQFRSNGPPIVSDNNLNSRFHLNKGLYPITSPEPRQPPYIESKSETRSGAFAETPRAPYLHSHNQFPSPSPQTRNHLWQSRPSLPNPRAMPGPVQGGRYLGNGSTSNMNGQPQRPLPLQQPQQNQRRPSQSVRPQVRLPNPPTATSPNNERQQVNAFNRSTPKQSSEAKTRTPPNHLKSSRRHKQSNSTSSKTSTGSNPWSNQPSTKPSTSPSSPDVAAQLTSLDLKTSSLSLEDKAAADEEWLLLRQETMEKPRVKRDVDPYANIHPLVRKWAAHDFPEVKPGEPRWANAVMSRRWQKEEELERDKKEMLERQARGEVRLWPAGCRSEKEEEAYQMASKTLEMMKDMITHNEKRTNDQKENGR